MDKIQKLREMVDESHYIVFFGGAGVSTESGIKDYRSVDGLYSQRFAYPPETMLSHSFYVSHTEEFYDFYRAKMLAPDAQPNAAHRKLAQWEQEGKLKAVITQNIDGLHQAAGSERVLELHGSVHRNYCRNCGKAFDAQYVKNAVDIPLCDACGSIIKPDVVLYGEQLDDSTVSCAIDAISRADTLIIGGTSLAVYPAAGFVRYFSGRNLIVINGDHFVHILPAQFKRQIARLLDCNAVGDGLCALKSQHMTGLQRSLHACCAAGLNAHHAHIRMQHIHRRRHAAGQSAAANRHNDGFHIRQIIHDLKANRTLTGDDHRIIERMNEGVAFFITEL